MAVAPGDPLDALLRRSWHAVALEADVAAAPVPVTLLDERLVLARLDGEIRAFDDQCPHRGAALSVGWVDEDQLVCPYHGWRYGGDGGCVRIPSLGDDARLPPRAALVPRHVASRRTPSRAKERSSACTRRAPNRRTMT